VCLLSVSVDGGIVDCVGVYLGCLGTTGFGTTATRSGMVAFPSDMEASDANRTKEECIADVARGLAVSLMLRAMVCPTSIQATRHGTPQ